MLPTDCLSVPDRFVGLALNGLNNVHKPASFSWELLNGSQLVRGRAVYKPPQLLENNTRHTIINKIHVPIFAQQIRMILEQIWLQGNVQHRLNKVFLLQHFWYSLLIDQRCVLNNFQTTSCYFLIMFPIKNNTLA